MFLPIGDSPNPRDYTPWMNWALIGANILVFVFITIPLSRQGVNMNDPLLQEYLRNIADQLPPGVTIKEVLSQVSSYDLYTFVHGYKSGAPRIADLFYSMFLHGGILHLAGNMLFLWIYGDNVEYRLGKTGYLIAYLFTGALATLFFALLTGPSMVPLVGASGAISGILGLYFLLFPRNKIKVFIALIPFYVDVIFMPSRLVLGIFLIIDNILPFLISSQSAVAYGAHIGGFLGGLSIAFVGERFSWHWPWKDSMRHVGNAMTRLNPASQEDDIENLLALRAAMNEKSPDKAVDILAHMEGKDVSALRTDECITLSQWLDESGHPIAASRMLRQCVTNRHKSETLADVYLALGLLRLKQGQPTAAYQYLLSALENQPSEETEKQTREALKNIDIFRSAR